MGSGCGCASKGVNGVSVSIPASPSAGKSTPQSPGTPGSREAGAECPTPTSPPPQLGDASGDPLEDRPIAEEVQPAEPSRLLLWSWAAGAHNTRMQDMHVANPERKGSKRPSYHSGLPGGEEIGQASQGSYEELAKRASETDVLPATVEKLIRGDVPRTYFPGHSAPEPIKAEALERVLRALALWDPKLGYCQGLNFLAAFALDSAQWQVVGDGGASYTGSEACLIQECSTGSSEADAFWLVACLLRDYGARGLFLERTPLLKLYSFCLARLIEHRLPELHEFLCGIDAVLGFKWFGTLLTTMLPPAVASRAWDMLLRDGLQSMLYVALGLCALVMPALLAAREQGEEAHEAMGNLQRRLPQDVSPLMPPGWTPQPGDSAGTMDAAAGAMLVKAAKGFAGPSGGGDELEALLVQWRAQNPEEAVYLGDDFTFRRGKRWQTL